MSSRQMASGTKPTSGSPELRFWVAPADGLHYEVDLTEFATGGRVEDQRGSARAGWGGDFLGRPGFAVQIAELIRLEVPPAAISSSLRSALRFLMRFLDTVDPAGCVDDVGCLTDVQGIQFRRWAEDFAGPTTYRRVLAAIRRMRDLGGYGPLLWPGRHQDRPSLLDDVDQWGLRRLFHAFRHEARAIKAMFAESERLADLGQDPRGTPRNVSPDMSTRHARRDQAWLVRHLTSQRLLSKTEIREQSGRLLYRAMPEEYLPTALMYLAPGMGERTKESISTRLRWFHPGLQDTAVFLWLFLLATGWNLATCLSLDVSEEANWVTDHPYKSDAKLIHAYKARAGREVFAYSAARPEFHPYQIVQYMIARTACLRETLRHRLAIEEERNSTEASYATEAEIERLRRAIRSPWLYRHGSKVDGVDVLAHQDVTRLNAIARIAAERAGLLEAHPTLSAMTTSIARDGWMAHAYENSGFSVVMAQLAGQHSDARSLLHYLRRRRYRTRSERIMRRVQDAAFAEIEARRPLDATRLRLMVEAGDVTPEQERRLLDHRMRSRVGMGCLDPLHPPRHVEPDHREGTPCRVQRCTGCRHGIVFQESLRPLARRRAELLHLHRTLPFAVWAQSSFGGELRSIEQTLEAFDADEVRSETEGWQARIGSGEVAVHDTYPL